MGSLNAGSLDQALTDLKLSGILSVDDIAELTSAHGVTIDGENIKDGKITTQDLDQIGDGSAYKRLSAAQQGALHTKYAISEDLLDEDDMASDSAVDPPSQQSAKAFAEGFNSNGLVDLLIYNGCTISNEGNHPIIYMPNADVDCGFRAGVRVPKHISTTGNIRIIYTINGGTQYDVNIGITSHTLGNSYQTHADNIQGLTASNFPTVTTKVISEKTIAINDADLVGGDIIGLQINSRASNSGQLHIYDIRVTE